MEVRMISEMAADRRVVAEDFVLDYMLARDHCIEKIRNMHGGIIVALWQ